MESWRRVPREPHTAAARRAWEDLDPDSRRFVVEQTYELEPVEHPLAATVQADFADQMLRLTVLRTALFAVAATAWFVVVAVTGGIARLAIARLAIAAPLLLVGIPLSIEVVRRKRFRDALTSRGNTAGTSAVTRSKGAAAAPP